jgi:N-acetyl-1-D-myo-inositol-2-amino-2-deoxy-alpha-D-glucopyranoside deacetylase
VALLAVFAHPDDESLAAGGLLARHAACGDRTAVVTTTWAEGTPRAGDLADALSVLGAGSPRMLGYADARVPDSAPGRTRLLDAPLDEVVRLLVAHIREFRPELIVTHDAFGGLTGHPDHVHTHRVTLLAAQAAGLAPLYPDAGAPWRPSSLHWATHPHSALPRLKSTFGARRSLHTVPDEQVSIRLDVSPWLDTKLAEIAAHRAEVERGALPGLIASLGPDVLASLLATEWYVDASAVLGQR